MTDETNLQAETPAEDAPALPVADSEAEPAAPSTATDEATEQPPADDTSKPEPKGVGKRIDELTRYRREAERDRDYWRELAMRNQATEKAAEPEAPPAPPAKLPALADYEYDEAKYQAALVEFTRAEARREAEAVLKAERDRQAAERRAQTWTQKEAEFAKEKPDYRERVTDPTLPISRSMAQVIQQSELGPEVAYYFAENRDVAAEIAALPTEAAALAIGRIEGRLLAQKEAAKAAAAAPKPAVTKAPPPPPRIAATEPDVMRVTPDSPESDTAMSDAEWMAKRNKQTARKR